MSNAGEGDNFIGRSESILTTGRRMSKSLAESAIKDYRLFLKGTGIDGGDAELRIFDDLSVSDINHTNGFLNVPLTAHYPITEDLEFVINQADALTPIFLHEFTHAFSRSLEKIYILANERKSMEAALNLAAGLPENPTIMSMETMALHEVNFSVQEASQALEEVFADLAPSIYLADHSAVVHIQIPLTKEFLISKGLDLTNAETFANESNLRSFNSNVQPACNAPMESNNYTKSCKLRHKLAAIWNAKNIGRMSLRTRQQFVGQIMTIFSNANAEFQEGVIASVREQKAAGIEIFNMKVNSKYNDLEVIVLKALSTYSTK